MTHSISELKLVILIPAYQPGLQLVAITDQLVAANFSVVVVNDGSDYSYQKIFNALNKNVHVVNMDANRGKGVALKTGYQYIKNVFQDYIIITADADGQHHPDDIEKIANEYRRYPHSLLLGSRTFVKRDVPLRSKLGNIMTNNVFSVITKRQLHDTQTGLRAFDYTLTDDMLKIPGERFEYEMNVLLWCSTSDITIVEIPVKTIYENNNGSSHFKPIIDSWKIYREVFKFISSSLLAFSLDLLIYIVLVELTNSWHVAASVTFANIAARVISAGFNFSVNKHIVFKHNGSVKESAISYFVLAGFILAGSTITIAVLTSLFLMNPLLAKIITELIFFILSYVMQRHIIFKNEATI